MALLPSPSPSPCACVCARERERKRENNGSSVLRLLRIHTRTLSLSLSPSPTLSHALALAHTHSLTQSWLQSTRVGSSPVARALLPVSPWWTTECSSFTWKDKNKKAPPSPPLPGMSPFLSCFLFSFFNVMSFFFVSSLRVWVSCHD